MQIGTVYLRARPVSSVFQISAYTIYEIYIHGAGSLCAGQYERCVCGAQTNRPRTHATTDDNRGGAFGKLFFVLNHGNPLTPNRFSNQEWFAIFSVVVYSLCT